MAAPRLSQRACVAAAALARRRADRARACLQAMRSPASRSCRWTPASTPAPCIQAVRSPSRRAIRPARCTTGSPRAARGDRPRAAAARARREAHRGRRSPRQASLTRPRSAARMRRSTGPRAHRPSTARCVRSIPCPAPIRHSRTRPSRSGGPSPGRRGTGAAPGDGACGECRWRTVTPVARAPPAPRSATGGRQANDCRGVRRRTKTGGRSALRWCARLTLRLARRPRLNSRRESQSNLRRQACRRNAALQKGQRMRGSRLRTGLSAPPWLRRSPLRWRHDGTLRATVGRAVEEAQRQAAFVVRRVLDGAALPAALAAVAADDAAAQRAGRPPPRARAGTRLRNAAALGHARRADARARDQAALRPGARALVAVALYQLDHTRAPPFAIVDHAVERRGADRAPRGQGARQRAAAPLSARARRAQSSRCAADPVARWSYPRWWIDRVRARISATLGSDSRRRQRASAARAARQSARDHARRAARCIRARRHRRRGRPARPGIIVDPPRPVTELARVSRKASSRCRISARNSRRRCLRVEPACACSTRARRRAARPRISPSSPTSTLVALDIDAARLARVRENLDRLQGSGAACARS